MRSMNTVQCLWLWVFNCAHTLHQPNGYSERFTGNIDKFSQLVVCVCDTFNELLRRQALVHRIYITSCKHIHSKSQSVHHSHSFFLAPTIYFQGRTIYAHTIGLEENRVKSTAYMYGCDRKKQVDWTYLVEALRRHFPIWCFYLISFSLPYYVANKNNKRWKM